MAFRNDKVVEALAKNGTVILSFTGISPHSLIHNIRFWYYTIPAYTQAQTAPGNLFIDTYTTSTAYHTFGIWENRECMRAYATSGAHLQAMKNFRTIGTGKIFSYETDEIPLSWVDVLKIWDEHGAVY